MILASITGAMLLASPVVASAATPTKDSKTTTAPVKQTKQKKTHKTATAKPAPVKKDAKSK
jgi:hypothetical protein